MRATSSTLFVRVNTGVTENAGMETRDSRKVTMENPKPTRVTELTFNKNIRIALRAKVCVFTKITAIRSFGHGLHTECSAEVDSAFQPPRDGK